MAVCSLALPWLYNDLYDGDYWYYLTPLMYCQFATSYGTTTGGCDSQDDWCDYYSEDPRCEALTDGKVTVAMYLIGCVAACVGGIMALVDLCKKKRVIRIVAYVCFIATAVLFIIGTAVFYSACDDFLESPVFSDMDYSTGASCGVVAIVMLVPAAALYILFVVFRMKFGDN